LTLDFCGDEISTYTWFSGRVTASPLADSMVLTWAKSQSLAAKPPTRITCCNRTVSECDFSKGQRKASDRYLFAWSLHLILDGLNNTVYRRLEEFGDIDPRRVVYWETALGNRMYGYSPRNFQLTKSNTAGRVVIPCGSKFDKLRVCSIAKPGFGSLVKTLADISYIVHKGGFSKVI
jgi:hypothetical protein